MLLKDSLLASLLHNPKAFDSKKMKLLHKILASVAITITATFAGLLPRAQAATLGDSQVFTKIPTRCYSLTEQKVRVTLALLSTRITPTNP
jgi:hypothetical protein